MIRVGLTGGIGSGKSRIAQMFRRLGAHLIDADALARKAVAPGTAGLEQIIATFGRDVLNPDGTLARAKLARLVFDRPDERARLNAIVHPYVASGQEDQTRAIIAMDPGAVILYDAALLIETGAHRRMDRVILVTIDRPEQERRVMERDGLTREEAIQRIEAQRPTGEKMNEADYLIDGGRPLPEIASQVAKIYEELKALA